MLNYTDGRFMAQVALDTVAQAQERIVDDEATLTGVQITLVIATSDGVEMVTRTEDVGAVSGSSSAVDRD